MSGVDNGKFLIDFRSSQVPQDAFINGCSECSYSDEIVKQPEKNVLHYICNHPKGLTTYTVSFLLHELTTGYLSDFRQ